MKLDGKVAIITGGAGGIGRGLTRVFVREGAQVLFVDTNLEAGRELEAELGENAVFHHRDLSTEGAAEAIREAAVIAFGRVDILVNNANRSTPAPLLETTPEIWAQAFGSAFTPTQRLMMVCHDLLARSGGSIINFASGAGLTGSPTQGAYAAAKEAIRGVSRVAANEWGPEGIRVNVVCPYALTEGVQWWTENYPEQAAAALASVPLGRIGDVEKDIAPVVVFLASDDSGYITGQTIMIDGGGLMVR
ncbi:SDR family oxidoreductase [Mycetocola tolaasinivorans]|uniref:SDR family oxidoreductase n=1 Tax=Mycetocola tolaasinivorans TaxID=76635 RepID=A0A3L7A679_9MICO|nr:SDR family oxidoreductase [Mycetocola tolaasinivorans]RLP75340.1 SDR family oxidoreductase [Mycetocola tolaasinivorans]